MRLKLPEMIGHFCNIIRSDDTFCCNHENNTYRNVLMMLKATVWHCINAISQAKFVLSHKQMLDV